MSEPKTDYHPDAQNSGSLKSRAFKAGSWTVSAHFVGLVLRLASNLIMTRLLAPELFGIMAIAGVIQVVTSLLADIGLRQAIIQSPKGGNRSFQNTAWTVQVVRGFWIWGVCLAAATVLHTAGKRGLLPPESVYAASGLPFVVAISSFSAVIGGFQSMKSIIKSRNLDLRRITLIDLIAQVAGLAVGVLLGWTTHSIWSFVASGLVGSALTTILSHVWLDGPADRFEWNRSDLHELVQFGKWIALTSALAVLASNGDRLLLGVWLSPTELGYYSIALNLATVIDGLANRLFSNVSLPALSEVARRQLDRVAAIYFRMRLPTDTAFLGLAGFLFATGAWIAALLYDARYAPVGPMLQLLSFGLLFTRYNLAHIVYLALGRPSYVTVIGATKFISLCVLVPALFYWFGIKGAIAGVAFHMAPTVLWVFWFNWRHKLYDVRRELAVLAMWPIGWLAGIVLLHIVHA